MAIATTAITSELAAFAAGLTYESLPDDVRAAARMGVLDFLGVALGGTRQDLAPMLRATVEEFGGQPQATVLGLGLRTSATQAALLNGALGHALDFDDTHVPSIAHASGPALAAAFAVGEWQGADGRAVLAAYVAGFEITTRVGMAARPALFERCFHATGVVGHCGAAVAAGKLLGLDAAGLQRALGIAATMASGLMQSFGTMCKPLHAGKAAHDGVLAAALARRGFTAAEDIVEGRQGLLAAFAGGGKPERALRDLGTRWELLHNTYKPYAACQLTHAAIDAARELRARYHLTPDQVVAIEAEVQPSTLDIAAKPAPQTALEGKFSIQYCIALALAEGEAGEDRFTDAQVRAPALVELRERVRLRPDPARPLTAARLTVETTDGRRLTVEVPVSKGNPDNPMTREEFVAKFRGLAVPVLGVARAATVVDLVDRCDSLPSIAELIRACVA